MGRKLKTQEELQRAKENGGNAPRREESDGRDQLSDQPGPQEGGSVEALSGEDGGVFHGSDGERSQGHCHRDSSVQNRCNPKETNELGAFSA